jgi:hypothetical protein
MNTKSNLGWVLSVTQRRLSAVHLDRESLLVAILLMNSLSLKQMASGEKEDNSA